MTLYPTRFVASLVERERHVAPEARSLFWRLAASDAYAETRAWLEGFVASRPEGEQARLVSRLRDRRNFLPALIEAATGAALVRSGFAVAHEPQVAGRRPDFYVAGPQAMGALIVEVTTVVAAGQAGSGRDDQVVPVSAKQLWTHIRHKAASYGPLAEGSDLALVVVAGTGPGELCAADFLSYLRTPRPRAGGVVLESMRPELSALGLVDAFAPIPRLHLVANPAARRPVPEALLGISGAQHEETASSAPGADLGAFGSVGFNLADGERLGAEPIVSLGSDPGSKS